MQHITIKNNNLIWYNALNFSKDHLLSESTISKRINEDLQQSGLQLADFAGKKLVLSFQGEGHDAEFAKPLTDFVQQLPIQDLLVIFNTVNDTSNLPYQAWAYQDGMIDHANWFKRIQGIPADLQVDSKFICLMSRPSESRAKFANKILNTVSSLRLSFGIMSPSSSLRVYQEFLPGRQLPITLGLESDLDVHDQTNPVFRRCLCNIVVESSSQSDSIGWHTKYITEKTFKAFGLRQIPIWVAIPGLVEHIRKLGFDLFDDLIDHGYDSILDENQRQQAVVNQIKQFDQTYSLPQCQDLRQKLAERLEKNYQLLVSRSQQGPIKLQQILKEFLKENC